MSACLCLSLSLTPPGYPTSSIIVCVCVSVCLYVHLSLTSPPGYPPTLSYSLPQLHGPSHDLSICLSICQSVCRSIYLSHFPHLVILQLFHPLIRNCMVRDILRHYIIRLSVHLSISLTSPTWLTSNSFILSSTTTWSETFSVIALSVCVCVYLSVSLSLPPPGYPPTLSSSHRQLHGRSLR